MKHWKLSLLLLLAATTLRSSAVEMGGYYTAPASMSIAGNGIKLPTGITSDQRVKANTYLPWWFSVEELNRSSITDIIEDRTIYYYSFLKHMGLTNITTTVEFGPVISASRSPETITYSLSDDSAATLSGTTLTGIGDVGFSITGSSDTVTDTLELDSLYSSVTNILSYEVQTNSFWWALFQEGSNLVTGVSVTNNNLFVSPSEYDQGGDLPLKDYQPYGYNPASDPAAAFVRNTNCTYAGIDTSFVSVWNSHQGTLRAGTLITPRHILFVNHFQAGESFTMPTNTTIRFVTMDGTEIDRTMIEKVDYNGDDYPEDAPDWIGSGWGMYTDISVGLLNTPITEIDPIAFPAFAITNALPLPEGLPIFYIDKIQRVQVGVGAHNEYSPPLQAKFNYTMPSGEYSSRDWPTKGTFSNELYYANSGDSGTPSFLLWENKPYFLGCAVMPIFTSATMIPEVRQKLKDIVAELDPAYEINEVEIDTSGYTLEQ